MTPLESNTSQSDIAYRTRNEFVRAFLTMGMISVIADIFIASLVLYLSWSDNYPGALLFSFVIIFLLNIQLFITYRSYKKATTTEQNKPAWYDKTRTMTLAHGAAWGIFSSAAYFTTDSQSFIYVMLILLTLTVSAVPVLSQLFGLFAARTLLMLGPTVILAQVVHRFDYPIFVSLFQIIFPVLLIILGYMQYLRSSTTAKLNHQKETMLEALDKEVEERRRIEEDLRRAVREAQEANAAKSRFLANISHEIRTPLTVIRGLSELMHNKGNLDSELAHQTDIIRRNSQHLNSIINDVLDMAKVQSGKLGVEKELCNIPLICLGVAENFELLCKEKGLQFTVKLNYPLPIVANSDPTRIRQIVFNLLNNALKFTEKGGITVEISYNKSSQDLEVAIQDTGIGLTDVQQEKIFHAFEQADIDTGYKFGGTGLGLSISKELARLLSGDITVESQKDVGSTFRFTTRIGAIADDALAHRIEELKTSEEEELSSHTLLNGRILVAEDNEDIRFILCHMLEQLGLEHTTVENGLQAVKINSMHEFDLILMDMNMPEMDGISATRKLRDQGATLPIIGLTANVNTQETERFWEAGIDDYLLKPIDPVRLHSTLSAFVKEKLPYSSINEEENIYEEYSHLFLASLKKAIHQMKKSIENNDRESLYRAAHDIKGQASAYQYHNLKKLAEKLETIAMHGQSSQVTDALKNIEAEYHHLRSN